MRRCAVRPCRVTVVSPTPGRPTARPEPGATRQSLEIYFRLALDGAQKRYRDVVSNFPVSSREISVSIEARLSPFVSRHLGVHGACSFLPGSSSRSPGCAAEAGLILVLGICGQGALAQLARPVGSLRRSSSFRSVV